MRFTTQQTNPALEAAHFSNPPPPDPVLHALLFVTSTNWNTPVFYSFTNFPLRLLPWCLARLSVLSSTSTVLWCPSPSSPLLGAGGAAFKPWSVPSSSPNQLSAIAMSWSAQSMVVRFLWTGWTIGTVRSTQNPPSAPQYWSSRAWQETARCPMCAMLLTRPPGAATELWSSTTEG